MTGARLQNRLLVGVVTGVRGLRGDLRVKSFTADPSDIGSYGVVTGDDPSRSYSLKVLGEAKGVVICRIKGVDDRTAAEALKGERFYIDRTALPTPDEDEFYHTDLIGLNAVLLDGTALGTIAAVYDFGAGDMLEVKGKDGKVHMIPFTLAAVPNVDLAAGRVEIADLPGLLEDPEPEPTEADR